MQELSTAVQGTSFPSGEVDIVQHAGLAGLIEQMDQQRVQPLVFSCESR